MDNESQLIFDKFSQDMQESGVFVTQPRDNKWNEPGFRYEIKVGLYRHLKPEVSPLSAIHQRGEILRNNGEYLNSDEVTCWIDFRRDQIERGRLKKDCELRLPGHIDNPSTSLKAMVDGVRLLTTLESWAYNNGKLINNYNPWESNNAIGKHYVLDKEKILSK